MKLRTQLILAFLFLTILPLTGITLYSYGSSISAFRRAVEQEARALIGEMNQRMELVTADLDRSIEQLGELPYRAFWDEKATGTDREADRFLSQLMKKMGENVSFLESLEFTPTPLGEMNPPEPVESAAAMPRRAAFPQAAAVTIQLPRMLFHREESGRPQQPPEGAFVLKSGEKFTVLHRRLLEEGLAQVELVQALGMTGTIELEALVEKIGEKVGKGAEAFAKVMEMHAPEKHARTASYSFSLGESMGRDFGCKVQRGGEVVGTVKARVRSGEVLQSVLSRSRRERGEIPFAVTPDGNIYTPDPADRPELEDLQVGEIASAEGWSLPENLAKNWVIVTKGELASGLTFGIARPVGEALEGIRLTAVRNLGLGLGFVAVALIGILPLSNRMTRNLSTLNRGAARLAKGDLDTRVPVRSRDEFGKLAQAFNQMAQDLSENQQRLLQQERLRKELEMCRQIQEELMPHDPLQLGHAEIKGISIPAREVGGDFFNYFTLPDGDMALLVGDVSGKGIPAALLMANLQATLRARMPLETDLASLVANLDREIGASTPPETFISLFVAILDSKDQVLRYVNAGHNTQYAIRADGTLERLGSSGRPVGMLPGGAYEERRASLKQGDSLFLYTDGLVEAFNEDDEFFGEQRLESLIVETREGGVDMILGHVEQALRDHRGNTEPSDDATLMVLRVEGAQRSPREDP